MVGRLGLTLTLLLGLSACSIRYVVQETGEEIHPLRGGDDFPIRMEGSLLAYCVAEPDKILTIPAGPHLWQITPCQVILEGKLNAYLTVCALSHTYDNQCFAQEI